MTHTFLHLVLVVAMLAHALLGCCQHHIVAALAWHGTVAEHDHGHPHAPSPAVPCPAPHEEHDCACNCQWVNNAAANAPLVLGLALDGAGSLTTWTVGQLPEPAKIAHFGDFSTVHPLPLRAHLAFCRLLI